MLLLRQLSNEQACSSAEELGTWVSSQLQRLTAGFGNRKGRKCDITSNSDRSVDHTTMDELLVKLKIEKEHGEPFEEYVANFVLGSKDVVIITPPKCGTTWLSQIVHQLRTGGDESFDDIMVEVPYLRSNYVACGFKLDDPQKAASLRCFRSHEPISQRLAGGNECKIIWCLRRPEDASLSYYKFLIDIYALSAQPDVEQFYRHMILADNQHSQTLWNLTLDWWKHRHNPRVLSLFYEDMHRDFPAALQKIANHLEISMDEAKVQRVLSLCSFDYMRKNGGKFNGEALNSRTLQTIGCKAAVCHGTVREGKMGRGKSELPQTVLDLMRAAWQDTITKATGIDDYDALMKTTSMLRKG